MKTSLSQLHVTRWNRLLALGASALIVASAHADDGPEHSVLQPWPISLGTSGGNINSFNGTFCCSGTLGALVEDEGGTQYILGSVILARAGFAQIGDEITQPGTRDWFCAPGEYSTVAHLSAYVPLQFYTSKKNKPVNEVTAAIAQVVPGAVRTDGWILDIGPVSPAVAAPTIGMRVKKSGRNTGLTFGTIKAINVAVDTDAAPVACEAGSGSLNNRMVNQIRIGGDGFAVMTADSGSLVVTDEALPRPVGIVWAHSPSFTLACRVDRALTLLSQVHGSTLSFPGASSSTTALAAGNDSTIDAQAAADSNLAPFAGSTPVQQMKLKRARNVQERHFDALFDLTDVVGHGIGLSDDGDPVLEIYLRNENGRSRAKIPAVLDNVPTRVLVTGPVIAD